MSVHSPGSVRNLASVFQRPSPKQRPRNTRTQKSSSWHAIQQPKKETVAKVEKVVGQRRRSLTESPKSKGHRILRSFSKKRLSNTGKKGAKTHPLVSPPCSPRGTPPLSRFQSSQPSPKGESDMKQKIEEMAEKSLKQFQENLPQLLEVLTISVKLCQGDDGTIDRNFALAQFVTNQAKMLVNQKEKALNELQDIFYKTYPEYATLCQKQGGNIGKISHKLMNFLSEIAVLQNGLESEDVQIIGGEKEEVLRALKKFTESVNKELLQQKIAIFRTSLHSNEENVLESFTNIKGFFSALEVSIVPYIQFFDNKNVEIIKGDGAYYISVKDGDTELKASSLFRRIREDLSDYQKLVKQVWEYSKSILEFRRSYQLPSDAEETTLTELSRLDTQLSEVRRNVMQSRLKKIREQRMHDIGELRENCVKFLSSMEKLQKELEKEEVKVDRNPKGALLKELQTFTGSVNKKRLIEQFLSIQNNAQQGSNPFTVIESYFLATNKWSVAYMKMFAGRSPLITKDGSPYNGVDYCLQIIPRGLSECKGLIIQLQKSSRRILNFRRSQNRPYKIAETTLNGFIKLGDLLDKGQKAANRLTVLAPPRQIS